MLGLVTLAIVSGIIVSGGIAYQNVLWIIIFTILFLSSAFLLGPWFLSKTVHILRHLDAMEAKLFISFIFVMVLAWVANLVGLAPIIGAFAAGLILHDGYFQHWQTNNTSTHTIKDLVAPLEAILVPIFFVFMGIQVKLEAFLDWQVVILAVGLLVAAIVGKLICGLGAGKNVNRLAVGIGMTPRGEVGLVFATLGKSLGIFSDQIFSAIVMMVMITTLMTPPLLKRVLQKQADSSSD